MKRIGKLFLQVLMMASLISCEMNNLGEATKTAKKLADNLYYIEISGDDGFDTFLEKGGASTVKELSDYLSSFLGQGPFKKREVSVEEQGFACSAFIAPDGKGGFYAGRNYDWDKCNGLIIRDNPGNGYASISTCNMDFLGFGNGFAPNNMINKIKALAGIYVPMDGINEKGLVVADLMAGDTEVTHQNTGKKNLTTTTAIRLLLNKAADIEEAVELLGQYDIHSDINTAHHFFMADSTGKGVVVEWVDGTMYVTETNVLTNHYLCEGKAGIAYDGSVDRLNKIKKMLEDNNNILNADSAKNILETVKAGDGVNIAKDATQWSIVYNIGADFVGEKLFWRSKYKKGFEYSIQ